MSAQQRVHGAGRIYRALVEAFSYPGRRVAVTAVDVGLPVRQGLPTGIASICYTLLDAETSVAGEPAGAIEALAAMTGAAIAPPVDAAFLVLADAALDAAALIAAAPEGTLVAPHRGATVIAAVARIASAPDGDAAARTAATANGDGAAHAAASDAPAPGAAGLGPAHAVRRSFVLTGPGIETERALVVEAVGDWVAARNDRGHEYPLGIDLILVDGAGGVVALPRTTRITEEARAWAT